MSIVIKSNNVALKSLGSVNILGKTAQKEFDAYKARVLADGGVINNEAKTLRAFELLFKSQMYGNMNTFVSGDFGVNINADSGINKLYAIDGVDLIGKRYGAGLLPVLDANNKISFSNNDVTTVNSGGLLTIETPFVMSKSGSFGYAAHYIARNTDNVSILPIAGLTKHDDTANTERVAALTDTPSTVDLRIQTGSLKLVSSSASSETLQLSRAVTPSPHISLYVDNVLKKGFGYRNDTAVTSKNVNIIPEIATESFYLDVGGTYNSDYKRFSQATIGDFMCFNAATEKQAQMLATSI